jgi:hypothetical protein
MSLRQCVALLASILLAVTAAQAQTSVRVRGMITAIDGNVLSVKSREGRDLQITLADNLAVSVAKAIRLEDIKPGDKLGVTSMPGRWCARFPAAAATSSSANTCSLSRRGRTNKP